MALLQLIASLFNQLHSPSMSQTSMECINIDFGGCEVASRHIFVSPDFTSNNRMWGDLRTT
jgi:hypothetical protein